MKKERIEKDRRVVKVELEEEEKYSSEFEKRITNSKNEREKIEQVISEIKLDEEKEGKEINTLNSIIEEKKNQFSDVRILYMNSQDKIGQIDRELERERKEKESILEDKKHMKNKILFLEKEIEDLTKNGEALQKEISEKITKYESENSEVSNRKSSFETLSNEERELNKNRKETESYLLHKKDSFNRVEESLERNRKEIEKLEESLSNLTEVATVEIDFSQIKELKEKLRLLENRLKNFQAVNLLAIEEFKELNQKFVFLTSQKEDLIKGKNVLSNLIIEIDDTIHKRFFKAYNEIDKNFNQMCRETLNNSEGKLLISNSEDFDNCGVEIFVKFGFFKAYNEIDKNFNQMCRETLNNSEGKLLISNSEDFDNCGVEIFVKFGNKKRQTLSLLSGGEKSMVAIAFIMAIFMYNSEDFDNCGVEIFVKFGNKKRQTLSLLSGGEKSMVAIAFIMAIFMYKPSPFTFLDEIEAALDEKNTRKLIGKLKEFTDRSQFILITHNKDTMRESETIFGVTMNKEIGISKIVPVKF